MIDISKNCHLKALSLSLFLLFEKNGLIFMIVNKFFKEAMKLMKKLSKAIIRKEIFLEKTKE